MKNLIPATAGWYAVYSKGMGDTRSFLAVACWGVEENGGVLGLVARENTPWLCPADQASQMGVPGYLEGYVQVNAMSGELRGDFQKRA